MAWSLASKGRKMLKDQYGYISKALGVLKYRLDRTAAENAELLRNIAKMGGGLSRAGEKEVCLYCLR